MPFGHEFKKHEEDIDYAESGVVQLAKGRYMTTWTAASSDGLCFGEKNAEKYEYQPIVIIVVELEYTENNIPTALR